MEVDLQKFWNINRRILMWILFFGILFLLREFFSLMFLTFIFAFVMRNVAVWLTQRSNMPYWSTVVVPYILVIGLLVLVMTTAIPRVVDEGVKFSRDVPELLQSAAKGVKQAAQRYGMEPVLAKYVNSDASFFLATQPEHVEGSQENIGGAIGAQAPMPVGHLMHEIRIDTNELAAKIQETLVRFLPGVLGSEHGGGLPQALRHFLRELVGGTVQFLLAILLSFLIVLDYEAVRKEMRSWRASPIGQFFQDASASVVNFSGVVGKAFQCQMLVALLNAVITCIGMALLDIQPLLLLTTIVFIFGLIPVLGVFISSAPIIMIAFNSHGAVYAGLALGMIVIVHLLEAYVFNPRIYAARFHLNPVVVLIILLVAHEMFGIWGMLLGIPVTHYILNVAQMPTKPKPPKRRLLRGREDRGTRENTAQPNA